MTLSPETVHRIQTALDRHWRTGWRPVVTVGSRLVAIHRGGDRG